MFVCIYTHTQWNISHKKNDIGSFVETWMDLESVIRSEVSQKEKNKYCILMHMHRIYKNATDKPIYRVEIEMQT